MFQIKLHNMNKKKRKKKVQEKMKNLVNFEKSKIVNETNFNSAFQKFFHKSIVK